MYNCRFFYSPIKERKKIEMNDYDMWQSIILMEPAHGSSYLLSSVLVKFAVNLHIPFQSINVRKYVIFIMDGVRNLSQSF
jgi:hypothetical protein